MSDTWDTFWRTSHYVNRAIPKQIKAINDALTKASNQANVFAVSYLLEQLVKDFDGCKSDYCKALADIYPSIDKKSEMNEQQIIADFEPLETQYTPVVIAAKLYINKYEEVIREASSSSSPNSSFAMCAMGYLPKCQKGPIPDFDGSDPEKFLEFAAIFEKMYHNDVLLVKLVNRVHHIITVPDDQIHLFSDATIILSWPPSDRKLFIRNVVAKITSNYPADRWNHVSSKQNPADIATSGFSTKQLIYSALWKHRPEFLCNGNVLNSNFEYDDRCLAYLSKPKVSVTLVTENSDSKLIYSCSSYYKLLRIFATAKVLAHPKRTKSNKPIVVTADDISFAENYILRIVQQCEFAEDYQCLSDQRKLCKRSRLRTLNPFIDDNGLIRSKSRLQNANIPFNCKCQVILSANGNFATIFVRYFPERYFHANRPFIVTYLSTRFTFVGGLNRLAKHIVLKCVTCHRYFSQTKPQQMSDLPADCVTPHSPFEATGVDFNSAFTVKCNFHRVLKYAKAYAAIFVFMVTRAVHIELVPELSTKEFLNAFKCFIARRGLPKVMYSDNGTNFRGAERYLNFKDADISHYDTEKRIDWQFHPPYTPHHGGIRESAVKSAKRFLPLFTKHQTFTYNELRVFLTQIESILNSRLIVYRNTAEPKEEILTPGHFLIGCNLCLLPEPSTSGTLKLSEQYRANCKLVEDFWKVWSTNYLNQLRCRSKWLDVQPNPMEGQIILYKESTNPPSQWPLAQINRVFPDLRHVVRTVEIFVNGQLKTVSTIQIIHLPT